MPLSRADSQKKHVARTPEPRTVWRMTNTNETTQQPSTCSALEAERRQDFTDALVTARPAVAALADRATEPRAPSGHALRVPRHVTNEALLTGLLYNALQHNRPTLVNVTRALNLLPDDCLATIGLHRDPSTGVAVTRYQIGRAWNRLAEACDASAIREGRRVRLDDEGDPVHTPRPRAVDQRFLHPAHPSEALDPAPTRKPARSRHLRALDDEEASRREQLLVALCDRLLQATVPEGLTYETLMMDWTGHGTSARPGNRRRTSADPDARFGTRRRMAGRGLLTDSSELFFGYNAHFAIGVGEVGGRPVPELALAMRVTPANDMARVAPIALEMLDDTRAAGHPILTVGFDRGYSTRHPETLHVPMAERGAFLVYDLRAVDAGRRGTANGAVLINGVPHCPFTPSIQLDELGHEVPLIPPGHGASREEWNKYWELRDQQARFQFRPHGKRRPDLTQRYECPALAGKVRCSLFPRSLELLHHIDVPDVSALLPGDQQPLPCCGRSFTADINLGLGRRQEPVHGTREWMRSYERRVAVERFSAAIRSSGIDRMDVRVLGRAKRTLMLAVAAAATNIQRLRNREAGNSDTPTEMA